LPAVAVRGGVAMARRLFAPLGYTVETTSRPLEPAFPEWGAARVLGLRLSHTLTVRDALRHLYVLLPVLDDDKHYFVEQAEADKLVRLGEGWLAEHPDREVIARRYLKRQGHLVRNALTGLDPDTPPVRDDTERQLEDAGVGAVSLNAQRHLAVIDALHSAGARRVLDLGCGEGR
ncbi:MAG: 3' terminal RNA ribose 2'-O-methyltransferase Hen1, partial [Myxococcales bacterium]|nr:3' terminal RNA ribose 2'-O-methyltransferase Hen1 [Myxococcales bacterium]